MFGLSIMIIVRVVPSLQISIDSTKSLSFESAPVSILSQNIDPGRLPAPKDGPVSITAESNIDPTRRKECIELMRDARLIFLRNGAHRWHLYEDLTHPKKFRMEVVVPSSIHFHRIFATTPSNAIGTTAIPGSSSPCHHVSVQTVVSFKPCLRVFLRPAPYICNPDSLKSGVSRVGAQFRKRR